jgi:hypothetical protein
MAQSCRTPSAEFKPRLVATADPASIGVAFALEDRASPSETSAAPEVDATAHKLTPEDACPKNGASGTVPSRTTLNLGGIDGRDAP